MDDEIWSADSACELADRMTAVGTPVETHFFAGEPHMFRPEARNGQWQLMVDFFGRHLAPR